MNTLDQCKRDGVFPITFHNYTDFGSIGGRPESVKDWVDLGITVGRTPAYHGGREDKKAVLAMLDSCAEHGIKCFVNDLRCSYQWLLDVGSEDEFRRGFAAALKDFGGHPALFGFDVGDEPAQHKIGPAFRTAAIHRQLAPALTPFLSFGGYSPGGTEWMGLRSYRRYLDEYVEIAKPNLLFFNNYGLLYDAPEAIEDYFRAHKMYTDAMLRHHLPAWVTLCCTGHMVFRCPTEDDIRLQVNTSAAVGCKGFAWYVLYMAIWQNYRRAPFDEHNERTETFQWLSRVLRTFQKMHGATLMQLTFQRCFFIGAAYGGYPYTIDSELVKDASVRTDAKFPLIVSEFTDDAGRDYVAIVNNSRDGAGQAIITWHGQPNVFRVGWEGVEEQTRRYIDDDNPANTAAMTGPWLAPGQMELYRVESDAPHRL